MGRGNHVLLKIWGLDKLMFYTQNCQIHAQLKLFLEFRGKKAEFKVMQCRRNRNICCIYLPSFRSGRLTEVEHRKVTFFIRSQALGPKSCLAEIANLQVTNMILKFSKRRYCLFSVYIQNAFQIFTHGIFTNNCMIVFS